MFRLRKNERRESDERGAITMILVLMMVPLLGVVAIVIDLGGIALERRELQNGAESSALGVGLECVRGSCGTYSSTAAGLSDANATDSASTVESVCGVGPGLPTCATTENVPAGALGWVKVVTKTDNPSNTDPRLIPYWFASFLGEDAEGKEVKASAVAAWGPPGALRVAPLTVSICEYAWAVGDPARIPSVERTFNFHSTAGGTCPQGPSGADAPGGFGWLAVDGSVCSTKILAGTWFATSTGNSKPNVCDLTDWQNEDIRIPIYDAITGTGDNIEYRIKGFASFHVTGYKFPGERWTIEGPRLSCPGESGNNGTCVRGYFKKYEAIGAGIGVGASLGVTTLLLVG